MIENSILAFRELEESGALSKMLVRHLRVFYMIKEPCTSRRAHEFYCALNNAEPNLNLFRSKVTMLVDKGYLREVGVTKDSLTNKQVALYQPIPIEDIFSNRKVIRLKRNSKKEIKERLLEILSNLLHVIENGDKVGIKDVIKMIDIVNQL